MSPLMHITTILPVFAVQGNLISDNVKCDSKREESAMKLFQNSDIGKSIQSYQFIDSSSYFKYYQKIEQ